MTDKTHCDRCGSPGPHKNGRGRTPDFPATVEISGFEAMFSTSNNYDLCASCSRGLAEFLGDSEMVGKMAALKEDE